MSARDRSWRQKFRNAFRGMKRGVRGQSSFFAHFFAAAAVLAIATTLGVSRIEWCLLIFAVTLVLVTEMLNTGMERLARAFEKEDHPELRDALDIGSAAVLLASLGAAAIGALVLGYRLGELMRWW